MSHETDGFTTGGRGHFPLVYGDSQQVGEFSRWTQETLEQRHNEYTDFLERTDISPRTRGEALRIMAHLVFELSWREGIYGASEN